VGLEHAAGDFAAVGSDDSTASFDLEDKRASDFFEIGSHEGVAVWKVEGLFFKDQFGVVHFAGAERFCEDGCASAHDQVDFVVFFRTKFARAEIVIEINALLIAGFRCVGEIAVGLPGASGRPICGRGVGVATGLLGEVEIESSGDGIVDVDDEGTLSVFRAEGFEWSGPKCESGEGALSDNLGNAEFFENFAIDF